MLLYTNQISRYYRAKDSFIAFPVRYNERSSVKENLAHMPIADRRQYITENYGREGTAFTDCLIMTSNDGFTFDRRDEAFLTSGPENRYNWWYGDCYMDYGLIETPADDWSAPNELSMYVNDFYANKKVNFVRYAIRIDGFFSWYSNFKGGKVLTKPLTCEGDRLSINFSTAALSSVTVTVCDESGAPIEGYASKVLFGDSLDRTVRFEKPLSALKGKKIRLSFTLRDAELYSFAFED
jgi:hypothetical protein